MTAIAKAFKVKVAYRDNAHPEQLIGVAYGSYSHLLGRKILTTKDAEDHCRVTLHHKEIDAAGESEFFECVKAESVSPEALPLSEVPKVVSVKDFAKEVE